MKSLVNPEMLTMAREIRGMTQKELSRKCGINQGKISRYEGGIVTVLESDLGRLANTLNFPEEFFRLDEKRYGVDPSAVFHRKRSSLSAIDRKRIDSLTNLHRISAAILFEQFEQITQFSIPDIPIDQYTAISDIAENVRAIWNVPSGPVKGLMNYLEQARCLVFEYEFGTDKLDETAQWIEPYYPVMLVNSSAPADRIRFSIAHALGHLVLHRNTIPTTTIEDEANEFAAAFLMPEEDIIDDLERVTIQRMIELKPKWGVSIAALIRRAKTLGVIGQRRYTSLFQQLSRLGYRKREPFPIPREKPQLAKLLLDSYKKDLDYSDKELAQLLRISIEDFYKWYYPYDKENRSKIIRFPTTA